MTFRLANTSLGAWDVNCSGYGFCEMQNVQDVGRSVCGMFIIWDVWDVECSGYSVLDMAYLGRAMRRIRDAQNLECGTWDVCLDIGC